MIENRQASKNGILVYPVYSRRSRGLSLGINLFPDEKQCSFDCPYCEVFPFSTNAVFSAEQMEEDLRSAVSSCLSEKVSVKDICFSGNGEPTQSTHFPDALKLAAAVRAEMVPDANLVLITNGAGLLDKRIFSLLQEAAFSPGLDIWLKVDAGTQLWYEKMNRSEIPFEEIILKIKEFAACAPFTIQAMLCAVDGSGPPPEESEAWEKLIVELAAIAETSVVNGKGGGIRKVQIYGKARPAPEDPKAAALPEKQLEARSVSLRRALDVAFASATASALTGADAAFASALTGAADTPPQVEVYP